MARIALRWARWGTRLREPSFAVFAALAIVAAACWPDEAAQAQTGRKSRIPAIELDGGTGWLGTDSPLRLRDLRGKIIILEFWTGC